MWKLRAIINVINTEIIYNFVTLLTRLYDLPLYLGGKVIVHLHSKSLHLIIGNLANQATFTISHR